MLVFFVPGIPQPKGSWKAFPGRGRRRVNFVPDNPKLNAWSLAVTAEAIAAMVGTRTKRIEGAVRLNLIFYLPRPKSLPKSVTTHTRKPDRNKLERAVCD